VPPPAGLKYHSSSNGYWSSAITDGDATCGEVSDETSPWQIVAAGSQVGSAMAVGAIASPPATPEAAKSAATVNFKTRMATHRCRSRIRRFEGEGDRVQRIGAGSAQDITVAVVTREGKGQKRLLGRRMRGD